MMNVHSFFSRLYQFPISRLVLLVVLAGTSVAFGEQVCYEAETVISLIPEGRGTMSAGSGTIINFDHNGAPNFIAFSQGGGCKIVEGKYGIDRTDQPQNKGRLIYRGQGIPYVVIGAKKAYTYHLEHLEITTVGNDAQGYGAYATKAVDNEGRELVINQGKIKIGDDYVTPDYGLSGKIP